MDNVKKVQSALIESEAAFDCILVSSQVNQRYVTGFDFEDGYVVIGHDFCVLLTDSRYIEAAKLSAAPGVDVRCMSGSFAAMLDDIMSEHGVKTVGYEETRISCASKERLSGYLSGREFVPAGELIEKCRCIKTADEIERIIKAQRIAEAAFEHILGFISPDRTEKEIALELEFYMRRHGAEKASFSVIAVSGAASSRPHGVPRDVKLEKGFLTMDFGATYEGYMSDMTRTVCIGRADEEMKKIYNTVLSAQLAALDEIKAGADNGHVDETARSIIRDAGYGDNFGHGLGHGVGMEIHEAPRLSPNAKGETLKVGQVVTCEPGIYIEGRCGVRIEDMGAVETGGFNNFTKAPKELIEL